MNSSFPSWEIYIEYFRRSIGGKSHRIFSILVETTCGEEKLIGNSGLKNIYEYQKELWIYIGRLLYRSKGIGKKVYRMLLRFGFDILLLDTIKLYIESLTMYRFMCMKT